MKTRMVEQREGEYLGPVDWTYNFRQHFDGYCTDEAGKEKLCRASVEQLKRIAAGGNWQATIDGGWPRFGWGRVLNVGMYDGWPYWRPVPSVMIQGPLGGEWHCFANITGAEQTTP